MARTFPNTKFCDSDEDAHTPESPARAEPVFWKDGSIRIGIHTSIAGGLNQALERAKSLGCNALQIFSMSPRMWPTYKGAQGNRRLSRAEVQQFRARRTELRLGPLVIHDNYLINLASEDRGVRTRSSQALREELVRAVLLGADFLVMHPGSGGTTPLGSAIEAVAEGLTDAVRGLALGQLRVLLENTAGQGTSIGWRFEHLKAILDACPGLPLGVCLDTAHAFAAGYDICCEAGLERTLAEFERLIGLKRLFVVHVNDSKAPAGSRVDRHEHIGRGKIGSRCFRQLLNHPLIAKMPGRAFILETPIDRPGDDLRNVRTLWRLFGRPAPVKIGASNGFPPRRHRKGNARQLLSKESARQGKAC